MSQRYAHWWATLPIVLLLAAPAAAQQTFPILAQSETNTPLAIPPQSSAQDTPFGAPYRTGEPGGSANVPLRDFFASRLDQTRLELLDRIAQVERQNRDIMDERDRQYAQRFAAQQEALTAALQAAEKAVANALSAAKEAVNKAEDASNKRFDSVNELRGVVEDQSDNFMTKAEANARFAGLEEKIENGIDSLRAISNANTNRLDAIAALDEGAGNVWGILPIIIGILVGLGGLAIAYSNSRRQA